MLEALDTRIRDIVQNKIECIRQRKDGVIPQQNYSLPGTLSQEEDEEIMSATNEYDIRHPNRAYDDAYSFQITHDRAKDMKWYIHLDDNMKKLRSLWDAENHG